uniref:Sec1-like protein n=1 Tax=Chaetoceros debilis TaxID=122233 RepID=A0A7S3QDU7_9STRA|mmetsp:Transcript_3762/g.5620  ORF Transcript_3762/g.5620 Transcript_3762/m.5620 type:complete len:677 (+) Transcript_3762:52-2082(+)
MPSYSIKERLNHGSSGPTTVPVEGLLPIVQERLQKEVFDKCSEKWKGDMLMVVDQASVRIISSAFGMYKLMENRVYLVEQLWRPRAPYRKSAPIYFLTPSEDSINRLVADWTPSTKRKEALYADAIFVYFTSALSDELFAKIKACKPLLKRLRALGELNIDFIASQTRSFHLDMNSTEYFGQLYNGGNSLANNASPSWTEHKIAEKLVTVCASLNEYPHIRYKASSRIGTSVARLFNEKFTNFIGTNSKWWYHGDTNHTEKGRATLMILSRSDDCLSPLIHEFTYEAMVHDLLNVEDDKITFQTEKTNASTNTNTPAPAVGNGGEANPQKDALLNENDNLWVELRAKHIADVIQILSTRIRDIVNSNTSVALNTKANNAKSLSLNQMAKALKALPEYREVMSKLSQHMHISHQCMSIFKKINLLDLSELEQTLATGLNDEGRPAKVVEMVEEVVGHLNAMPDSASRFRLLAIFIVSQKGLKPGDQSRLFTAANLEEEESMALGNLDVLGIPLIQGMTGTRMSKLGGERLVQRDSIADSGSEYSSSRYACTLKDVLSKMAHNELSFDEYPSIYPMPEESMVSTGSGGVGSGKSSVSASGIASVRGKTSSKFKSYSSSTSAVKKIDGSRQIVFMAGGACYSELRAANELMEKGGPEVILGSTHFIDPSTFVKSIASLK